MKSCGLRFKALNTASLSLPSISSLSLQLLQNGVSILNSILSFLLLYFPAIPYLGVFSWLYLYLLIIPIPLIIILNKLLKKKNIFICGSDCFLIEPILTAPAAFSSPPPQRLFFLPSSVRRHASFLCFNLKIASPARQCENC